MPGRHAADVPADSAPPLRPAPGHSHGHAQAHGHGHGGEVPLRVGRLPRVLLLGFLALCAVATVLGAIQVFPHGHAPRPQSQYAAPGVTFPMATVVAVDHSCGTGGGTQCAKLHVRLDGGVSKGQAVTVEVSTQDASSGLRAGDHVELVRVPGSGGSGASYDFFGVQRHGAMLLLLIVFAIAVLLVARLRGLMAMIGLVISGVVVFEFMLPALLRGHSGTAVALVGSAAIMFVLLYLAHGVSLRTSAALAGTLAGIGVTAAIGTFAVHDARLSGVGDEVAGLLGAQVHLDFQGLMMCTLIVASLGVLNDVTITQASAVWELRAASPRQSRRALFASAMRIGRDHIASTIYTIAFAYVGTALALLLLVSLYDRPLVELLNSEDVAEEVVRTLTAAIGLVLAVPLTTVIAVAVTAHASPRRVVDAENAAAI